MRISADNVAPMRFGRLAMAAAGRLGPLVVLVSLVGCLRLDGLVFGPVPAAAGENLLAAARAIPAALVEEHMLATPDGPPINAYLARHRPDDGTAPEHHRTGVLICHGSGGNILDTAMWVEALWSRGLTVLTFDYRGYGKSAGTPTELSMVTGARAAHAFLSSRDDVVGADRVVVYGFSIGAAVAVELAAQAPVPALLLEAPFSSMQQILSDNQPLSMPIGWFVGTVFDSERRIGRHRGRLWVAYGGQDTTTPPSQARRLVEAAEAEGIWVQTLYRPNAGHMDIPLLPLGEAMDGPRVSIDPSYVDHAVRFIAQTWDGSAG